MDATLKPIRESNNSENFVIPLSKKINLKAQIFFKIFNLFIIILAKMHLIIDFLSSISLRDAPIQYSDFNFIYLNYQNFI